MDADTLRLILSVAGGLVLVGLYLWERRQTRSGEDEIYEDNASDEDKREPRLGTWSSEADDRPDGVAAGRARKQVGQPVEPERPGQPELRLEPPDAPAEPRPVHPKIPLILSLHITSTEGTFEGEAIVHAAARCGVEPGEQEIFHHYAESTGHPLFSMANMVKPGTFPFGTMADFESPGLTLFSQAEGTSDDLSRLQAMLTTAHCLAAELKAEVRDETRELLTPETEEHLRDQVHELVAWRLSDAARR